VRLRRAGWLAVVAALAATAGSGFLRLFSAADLRVGVPVAATLPVVLVGLLRRPTRGAPFPVTVIASALAFLAWTSYTVAGHAGSLTGRLGVVRTGLVDGWARLLDVSVPAPADPDLLVVPVAVTWLAAAAGAEIAVRTRTRLLPAVPAVLALTAATALSVPAPGTNLPAAGVLAVLAGVLALLRGRPTPGPSAPSRPRAPGRLPRAAMSTLIVVAVGLLVGARLPGLGVPGDPVDPRAHRSPPVSRVAGLNPLSALAGWTAHPDDVLLRVLITGRPVEPSTLRLAVLAGYDGASWSSTARYARAGRTVPAPAAGTRTPTARVTQEIEVVGLAGGQLPAVDRPVEVTAGARRFAVDADSGTLLCTTPLTAGSRFRVVSAPPPRLAANDLVALTAGADPADRPYLAVPDDAPPVLWQLANIAAGPRPRPAGGPAQPPAGAAQPADTRGTPFQRAAMLQWYLSATFAFDPAVPPGHSFAHLEHFLADTRRGTSEQFATAFVLAARLLDLPSRLVVGFTAPAPAAGDVRTVRGGNALAWAEVHFDGVGWLPFFPTPKAADAHGAALAGSTQGESPEQAALVAAAVRTSVTAAGPPDGAAGGHPGRRTIDVRDWVAPAVLGGCTIAVGYLLAAVTIPALRRRRRRRAIRFRDRVVGAWQDAVDTLAAVGSPVPAAASPAEVARLGAAAVGESGSTALRGLAGLATLALFGPDDPGAWEGATGQRTAWEAWRLVDVVERSAWRAVPRRRRLWGRLGPAAIRPGRTSG
jgi:hypothetical protein